MEPEPCWSITRSPSDPLYPNDLYRAQSVPHLARMLLDHSENPPPLLPHYSQRLSEAQRFVENTPPDAELQTYWENHCPAKEEARRLTEPLPSSEDLRQLSIDEFRWFLKAYISARCEIPDPVRLREYLYPKFEAIDRLQLEPNFLLDYAAPGIIWLTYVIEYGLIIWILKLVNDVEGPFRLPNCWEWEELAELPDDITTQDIYLKTSHMPRWAWTTRWA